MRVFFTLLLLTPAMGAFAQQPYLYFSKINVDNGLSHNKVNCILQDKRGFIWIGTEDGLNRYDGQYFTVFRNKPNDTTTISGNIITDLLEDENDVIWITTADGGFTKYDYRLPADRQFKQFKHIQGDSSTIPVNIINKIVKDRHGYLWLATSGAFILRFDRHTETFINPVRSGPHSVASLALDNNDTLWVGRVGGSFLKININTLQYQTDYNSLYDTRLLHQTITSILQDDEDIWFGSWDNVLYRYNRITRKEEAFRQDKAAVSFPNDEVSSFAKDDKQRIWMGGKYFGLTIYDKYQGKFFNYRYDRAVEGSIADNRVNCIFIDKTGSVWLGTNNGISICNPSRQSFVQTFLPKQDKDISIYDFYQYGDQLWIGTSEGIFIQSKDGSFQLKKIQYKGESLIASSFFKDIDGTFYIGTQYSLFVYDAEKNTVAMLPNTEKDSVMNKIISSRVVSVVRDTIEQHPALLTAPYGHYIAYYDLVEKKWVSRTGSTKSFFVRSNFRDNLIRKLYKTKKGDLYLATAKYGLGYWQRLDVPKVNHLCNNPTVKTTISNDNVYDISEDAAGNLWVSTYGGGLNYYNTKTQQFTHITTSNNLLEGIQTDINGNVWIVSNGNLNEYNPVTKSYTIFNLPDVEKTGGVKGTLYKDNEGNLYAAGVNYFIRFNPLFVKEATTSPKTWFTDFKIFNTSYPGLIGQKAIELRYYQNYFSIEFSAPVFTGERVKYAYMLQGMDKNWLDAGNRNSVNYSNLRDGNYIFKVRASNSKGSWSSEIASVNITVIPPFWQRGWFFALCAAVISATAYLFYRYRINELLKRQAIRNKIAQDLHDNVGSTLGSIAVYSEVAKIHSQQNKQEKLAETLDKIGETSGEMINEMADIVWAINPRNDHVGTILQRMETYAAPLLQSKNIYFNFTYDESIPALNLEMNKRKNFYLIFKEAVNNAVKYADCKSLNVSVRQHHHRIELAIEDDGKGFETSNIELRNLKSLSGNGLKNMQMRAAEMKAVFNMKSKPGEGTHLFLAFDIP
ncbi:MAG: histidine kinase [Chitinophagaceae bacterium]|nr:histidine kinase [Chitinophagaceae bacterium]